NGRPTGKLVQWGFDVTTIAGGMKIGDRNSPGTRIFSEWDFRENKQILVATEAAGEGINLQFCWLMINYDIPWNPVRLEQRMGRIHRYGQEKDCLIFNFVATNTREGRVLAKLFQKIEAIEEDLDPQRTGKIFNVLGDIFPSNMIEKLIRDMYARNKTEDVVTSRIIEQVDSERLRQITNSTLEGLAKRELNLSAIIGKSEEAKEKRLVPEVIEDFFREAAPLHGIQLKEVSKDTHVFTVGKVPRNLWQRGEKNESRFGTLGKEYGKIIFDKQKLAKDNLLEWVTPGHPLFEAVREESLEKCRESLDKGAVFFDLYRNEPARLNLFLVAMSDGLGRVLHQKLFVTETKLNSSVHLKQPTVFLEIQPGECKEDDKKFILEKDRSIPKIEELKKYLLSNGLNEFQALIEKERRKEIHTVEKHIDISLSELINRQNIRYAEMTEKKEAGDTSPQLLGHLAQTEHRILELENRKEIRFKELAREKEISISSIQHLGSAWVIPHPDKNKPEIQKMVSNDDIEKIAVDAVIAFEQERGFNVQSVEADNRGFDLISRLPHPEDKESTKEVRFIEVKGRSLVGEIALTANEYRTSQRLQNDYYLYVVYNCSTKPEIHVIQNPAKMGWQPVVQIEHYHVKAEEILRKSERG
ncbi:MAG TPA: DUF3883 domain-containing protein, partial [Leptospiraceae bacterium]|nr:DUF3883 domain-containing protein [Leptospiraceae bacterium]